MLKITKKIKAQRIKKPEDDLVLVKPIEPRPDVLNGATYVIQTPTCTHPIHLTINNIEYIVNGQVKLKPYEILVSTSNIDQYMLLNSVAILTSALYKNCNGDISWIAEDLKNIFDPKGGYFKKGKGYINSIISELGFVLEDHIKSLNR